MIAELKNEVARIEQTTDANHAGAICQVLGKLTLEDCQTIIHEYTADFDQTKKKRPYKLLRWAKEDPQGYGMASLLRLVEVILSK